MSDVNFSYAYTLAALVPEDEIVDVLLSTGFGLVKGVTLRVEHHHTGPGSTGVSAMIRLTQDDGNEFLVNPVHVVYVRVAKIEP